MPPSMEELLQQVCNLADSLQRRADSAISVAPSFTNIPTSIPPLMLDPPCTSFLVKNLIAAGASQSMASELTAIHTERAAELAQNYSRVYHETCQELIRIWRSSSPIDIATLSSRVARIRVKYDKENADAADDIIRRVSSLFNSQSGTTCTTGKGFNNEYLRPLEAFFNKNRYPSRADKVYLAKRSNMSYRQINVWFQNRRSRSKMERETVQGPCLGKWHRRRDPPTGSAHHSAENEDASECEANESKEYGTGFDACRFQASLASPRSFISDEGMFSSRAPAHAFPTPYPPAVAADPFPCKSGSFQFPRPVWPRSSPPPSTLTFEECDINELASAFENLTLVTEKTSHDDGKGSEALLSSVNPVMYRSFAAPFTVHPYSTPLPSLVKSGHSPPAVTSPKVRRKTELPLPKRRPSKYRTTHAASRERPIPRSPSFGSDDSLPSLCRSVSGSSSSSDSGSDTDSPPDIGQITPPILHEKEFMSECAEFAHATPLVSGYIYG
ncbi:hypothetical protein BD410DRAFT_834430 [Rickenella mellea]|uniref:Homeobox domain-containing protein n=1 Tax=Rickenella mellea TaxID=50990 RepID=A0A4Y7QKX4_9AGAM|nr:hypothetical protein BD410DRAFT_834430 [Rickenella mellea]